MKLSNSFTIARPVQEVYEAFLDVERIATCMPGSTLLGQSGENTYEGEVKVKVGPLSVNYTGEFTILEQDLTAHRLTMRAKGREKRGAGNADAHIVASLSETDGTTQVSLDTDLSVRGKVAQFGRGVIGEVTDQIMQTFAANVEEMLVSGPAATGAATTPGPAPAAPLGRSAASATAPAEDSTPSPSAAEGSGDLDAWRLIVQPMLRRHAGSIATVTLSGVAAYLGARWGARAGTRRPLRRRLYY